MLDASLMQTDAAKSGCGRPKPAGTLLVARMEPGGIEPPSRDSQHAASTRLVIALISTVPPPVTA